MLCVAQFYAEAAHSTAPNLGFVHDASVGRLIRL